MLRSRLVAILALSGLVVGMVVSMPLPADAAVCASGPPYAGLDCTQPDSVSSCNQNPDTTEKTKMVPGLGVLELRKDKGCPTLWSRIPILGQHTSLWTLRIGPAGDTWGRPKYTNATHSWSQQLYDDSNSLIWANVIWSTDVIYYTDGY